MKKFTFIVAYCLIPSLVFVSGCSLFRTAAQDEAKRQGKTAADFPETAVDVFHDMDGGLALTPDEVKGRNTWMLWTGGNQAFWDYMAKNSFGTLDFLKTLSSYPKPDKNGKKYYYSRDNRFEYLGLMNEPGFKKATGPDQKYGLYLDERVEPESEKLDPAVYGHSSGIVGLRLFLNPKFDESSSEYDQDAVDYWDAERFYTDPDYYLDKELERPYRVGMSCAFCHAGPHPLNPPADPENPQWENLSTNVGAQYFWIGRIFIAHPDEENFVWQLFNSSPPGALDTSIIATDNINNPRTMNAIYEVGARLETGEQEEITGGALAVPGTEPQMVVPHILKDGADSVGILGALSRVYINIGEFHEEWIQHFKPIVGGKKQTPMDVATAKENSVYWQATEQRVGNLASFFLKAAGGHHLKDAPGGQAYLTNDESVLNRGKFVFADNCAGCHSSKLPKPHDTVTPFDSFYNKWVDSEDFKKQMRQMIMKPDFLENNYLSNEHRYSVADLKTNACAALATNGLRGHIWDNFTSETYKTLPAVRPIKVHHPLTGEPSTYEMPGGGRGYYRTPSLVSMWSTAPYLHNNALGKFTNDPSVAGRMEAFQDGVEKLLWPEKRFNSDCQETWGLPWCPPIYKTTKVSYLKINQEYLPDKLKAKLLKKGEEELSLGPIPKGTPINLLANLNNELSFKDPVRLARLVKVLVKVKAGLKRIKAQNLNDEQSLALLKELVPDLLEVNKCKDFVIDRGHEYGSQLSDDDKHALIEYLKTL
ncbi:hypothetical protein [Candidatus Nitrospira salsa]